MSTFALEKHMHLQQKQTHFILTLPVAGAVSLILDNKSAMLLGFGLILKLHELEWTRLPTCGHHTNCSIYCSV